MLYGILQELELSVLLFECFRVGRSNRYRIHRDILRHVDSLIITVKNVIEQSVVVANNLNDYSLFEFECI